MIKSTIRDRGVLKRNSLNLPEGIGSLRIKIFIMFIVFLIIVMVYHTYFEEPSKEKEENNLLKIKNISSNNILNNISDINVGLFNPTLIKFSDEYLLAFEKIEKNSTINIWLSTSKNSIQWSMPKILFIKYQNANKPCLNYIKDKYLVLSFEYNSIRHISISKDSQSWGIPQSSELYKKNDSIYYGIDYILMANQSGLWRFTYNEVDRLNLAVVGDQIIHDNLSNASICNVNDNKFIVVYENSTSKNNSLIITSIIFEKPEKSDSEIKWDLLIIFIILGFMLLVIIVQEVARD